MVVTVSKRALLAASLGLALSLGASCPLYAQDAPAPGSVVVPADHVPGALFEGWLGLGFEDFMAVWGPYRANRIAERGEFQQDLGDHFELDAFGARVQQLLIDPQVILQGDLDLVLDLVAWEAPWWVGPQVGDGSLHQTHTALLRQRLMGADGAGGVATDSFAALRRGHLALMQAGTSRSEGAALAAAWCSNQDLSQLNALQLGVLCDILRAPAPGMDAGNRAVVYEGTIQLPGAGAGEYTFSRHLHDRAYAGDDVIVQVGGVTVLDTRPNQEGGFTAGGPVELTAGSQPFTATFVRRDDPNQDDDVHRFIDQLLCWKAPGSNADAPPALIPGSVFTGPGGQAGLRARCYAADAFLDAGTQAPVLAEESVPGVDRMSSSVGQRYGDLLRQIDGLLCSPERVATWRQELQATEDGEAALYWVLNNAMEVLGAEERSALVRALCAAEPGWISNLPPRELGALMWPLAGIPAEADGNGAVVDLIKTWSGGRPRFRTRVGYYPGFGWDGYLKLNDDPYAHLGYVLGGYAGQWPLMQAIYESCINEADRSCDLEVLKLYLETAKIADRSGNGHGLSEVTRYVDQALADEALPGGDVRATWLVARAMCDEASAVDKIPAPLRAMQGLEQAFAEAESADVRFWALGEMMARLISVGESDWALSLLGSVEGQFPPDIVLQGVVDAEGNPVTAAAQFQAWRELAPVYAEAAAEGRLARIRQEDLGRLQAEVTSLEASIAELEAIQDDPRRGETARRVLAQVRQDLAAAKQRLEAAQAPAPEAGQ